MRHLEGPVSRPLRPLRVPKPDAHRVPQAPPQGARHGKHALVVSIRRGGTLREEQCFPGGGDPQICGAVLARRRPPWPRSQNPPRLGKPDPAPPGRRSPATAVASRSTRFCTPSSGNGSSRSSPRPGALGQRSRPTVVRRARPARLPVHETVDGATVWDGEVHVFALAPVLLGGWALWRTDRRAAGRALLLPDAERAGISPCSRTLRTSRPSRTSSRSSGAGRSRRYACSWRRAASHRDPAGVRRDFGSLLPPWRLPSGNAKPESERTLSYRLLPDRLVTLREFHAKIPASRNPGLKRHVF